MPNTTRTDYRHDSQAEMITFLILKVTRDKKKQTTQHKPDVHGSAAKAVT